MPTCSCCTWNLSWDTISPLGASLPLSLGIAMHFFSLFCQVYCLRKKKDSCFCFQLRAPSEERVHAAEPCHGLSGVRTTFSQLSPLELRSGVLVLRRSILLGSKLNGPEANSNILSNGLLEICKLKSHDNFLLQTLY